VETLSDAQICSGTVSLSPSPKSPLAAPSVVSSEWLLLIQTSVGSATVGTSPPASSLTLSSLPAPPSQWIRSVALPRSTVALSPSSISPAIEPVIPLPSWKAPELTPSS
jgi:hypothetical protein